MSDFLKSIAPTLGTLIGGPLGGMVVTAIGAALGMSEPTQDKITEVFQSGQLTGDQLAAVKGAEVALKAKLAELGVDMEKVALDLERVAASAADSVNKTMQVEAQAEKWPTYTWRPAIGFAVAANVVMTSVVVGVAYGGVILFNRPTDSLASIPAMIGAMSALIAVVSPILGIAAWFRGKMQATKGAQ